LSFLKEKGFQKKGMKYFKQKGEFVLSIYPNITHAYLNTKHCYTFNFYWEMDSLNPQLVQLSIWMGAKKNITAAGVMSSYIKAGLQGTGMRLTNRDQSNVDQVYVEGIQKEIETFILPLFNSFHSLDDVICLAEEEESLPREKRIFFPYNIYHDLTRF